MTIKCFHRIILEKGKNKEEEKQQKKNTSKISINESTRTAYVCQAPPKEFSFPLHIDGSKNKNRWFGSSIHTSRVYWLYIFFGELQTEERTA